MKKSVYIGVIILLLVIGGAYIYNMNKPTMDLSDTEMKSEMMDVDQEIITSEVVYHNDVKGYLARPEGDGQYPALILIHEWWGLNENIEDFAQRFARQGYVALAVDLYEGEVATTSDRAGELAGNVRENLDPAFANLEDAIAFLKAQEYVKSESLASVGWCFGGQWSYNVAVNNLGVDASIMYYGQFDPEDDFEMMKAQVLGHFGEDDRLIPVEDVKEFQAVLNETDGEHAVYIYPNAGHAFANEDNEEAYDEEAAELSWKRTLEFLEKHVN